MIWSEWAYRSGPATLYDLPGRTLVNVRLPRYMSPDGEVTPYPAYSAYNYPPLAAYLMWIQGAAWAATNRPLETHAVKPAIAQIAGITGGQLTSPVVNTIATRVINAALPTFGDYLMAWGVARLVRRLRGREGWPEVVAFTLIVLGPPIMLDSAFWTQMDGVLGCLLVWTLYFLVAERRLASGVCFGLALMTKAQAVLLVPVLAFIFAGLALRCGWRNASQLWKMLVAAVAVIVIVATPVALADRGQPQGGSLRWIERGYIYPITKQFPISSLKAFNIWWLDFVLHGQSVSALRADAPALGGLTKDQAGHVLTMAALLAAAAICAYRWRWEPPSWTAFAVLNLLAMFTFPTRSHERYIYFCLPFLVVTVGVYRPWWPVLVSLFVVAGFEMTWPVWLANPTAGLLAPAQSPDAALISLALSVLTVASFAYALISPLFSRGSEPSSCPLRGRERDLSIKSPTGAKPPQCA